MASTWLGAAADVFVATYFMIAAAGRGVSRAEDAPPQPGDRGFGPTVTPPRRRKHLDNPRRPGFSASPP
jgi:hypothetical protein